MRTYFPSFSHKQKYEIDFSLIPAGLILLELSAFSTEYKKAHYENLGDLAAMRLVHTIIFLAFAYLLAKLVLKLGENKLNYPSMALAGIIGGAFDILLYDFLANFFLIEPLSLLRESLTGLVLALFWFPAFVLVGSKRTSIFKHFKDYEQRLLVSTRAKSRNSQEFRDIQDRIQREIQQDLYLKSSDLKAKLSEIEINELDINSANSKIQTLLVGEELRQLSMKLETFGSEQSQTTILGQNAHSVRLLANQFKILYETTARKAPLKTEIYAGIMLLLITPAFINYFTLHLFLIYYPSIAITLFLSSLMVTRSLARGGSKAVRKSSIWLYITGLVPCLFNEVSQYFFPDPTTKFPLFVNVVTLPLGYYLMMKILQVLQPHAIDLVKNDEIVASKELREVVTKIVGDEFAHTLAHRWAIFIHGKILTRLAATALKLETSKNSGDFDSYRSTLNALTDLLSKPDSEFEQAEIDLDLEIASRLDPWLGLVDVDLHIEESLKKIHTARVHEVGEVIEEIISNSMRHGKSQSVSLRVIRLGDKDIEITAVDDASIAPPIDQTRFGLGTRIFNLASDSRWSITRVDSSTVFKLVMAIE
jgi:hypothetical protein